MALAFAGITGLTGYPDRPPVRPGYFVADYGAGMFAAFGAMLALRARDLTGRGQDVDMALYEAVWRMSGTHMANYGLQGKGRERSGNTSRRCARRAVRNQRRALPRHQRHHAAGVQLCHAIEQPELVTDERFTPRGHLLANHAAIHAILGARVAERTLDESGHSRPVRCAGHKVYLMEDIVGDPHFAARRQVVPVESTEYGQVLPARRSAPADRHAGPHSRPRTKPGRTQRRSLRGLLGMTKEEIESLVAAGVV